LLLHATGRWFLFETAGQQEERLSARMGFAANLSGTQQG
jgi:hypothetical protein